MRHIIAYLGAAEMPALKKDEVIACDKSALKYNYISFKKGDRADYNICSWPAGRFNLYGFCHKVEHGTADCLWLGEPWKMRMSVLCGAESDDIILEVM